MPEESPSIVHDVSVAAAVGRRALPNRLCTAFTESLGAQRAALSWLPRLEHWQLLHATDEPALQAEAAQFTRADGPSVSAALGMHPVFVPDLRDYPCRTGPPLSAELPGTRRVLALPLHDGHTPLGVLCLYYTERTDVTSSHITHAQRAAALALDALLRWRPVHDAAGSGCRRPVWTTSTRAARWERIHQAADYVAARQECDVAEGLAWLQEVSARDRLSLLDVADTVLQPSHAHHEDESEGRSGHERARGSVA
ncbi:GAF domain-containing protein [Streptomyces sp. BA2]|uniref:GAF domain-containing protein n=1 Tax=Streptomyces sp. BA2 TaxID=436595 RepID=UPI001324A677|nr:GAF domain-containing protein [Streptomyces sp. BA2]MWA09530.1 GAF domain-containing protein [Streptomyces sp. BA2]